MKIFKKKSNRCITFICALAMILTCVASLNFSSNQVIASAGVEGFVERMYTVALGRDFDEEGKANWIAMLTSATYDGASIAKEFILGEEFKSRNLSDEQFLNTLYATFFNRNADSSGKDYWMYVLNQGNTREFVLSNFVNLPEFTILCESYGIQRGIMKEDGNTIPAGIVKFVVNLYEVIFDRKADNDGLKSWSMAINSGDVYANCAEVAKGFLNSEEYKIKNKATEEFIRDLYKLFMGRDADESGLNLWVGFIDEYGMTRDTVVDHFAASEEFELILKKFIGNKYNVTDGGSVLNIYVWNSELMNCIEDCYPGYVRIDENTGKIGDVKIKWIITSTLNNEYQNNLDDMLEIQESNSANNKVDLFLVEPEYALKYIDSEYTVPMDCFNITDEDIANQYDYTKNIAKDSKGKIKALSWHTVPGALIYNRKIAKDVFGTDNPTVIQQKVKDWDTFNTTAGELKANGYYIVSGYDDTYRVFYNNMSGKWVQNGKIVIDSSIMEWVDQTKAFSDAGYNNKTYMWEEEWSDEIYKNGNVFCYFGPDWFINFVMNNSFTTQINVSGDWAVTEGPQGFFWGGSWICAANGTDNKSLIEDILKKMTIDETISINMALLDNNIPNNRLAMQKLVSESSLNNEVLGGQNPYSIYHTNAEKIIMNNTTKYDQVCNETFVEVMGDYFNGYCTKDEAIQNFYNKIMEKYPELSY